MGQMTVRLGVDIGGSGIKGALVDIDTGQLVSERVRLETPRPATPENVVPVVREVARQVGGRGRFGCTSPGVVRRGVIRTAPNMHPDWVGTDAADVFRVPRRPVSVLNDADAAGLAEATVGVARARRGVVMLLTFGTGIGSALLLDGKLVPNTELGHLELRGRKPSRGRPTRCGRTRTSAGSSGPSGWRSTYACSRPPLAGPLRGQRWGVQASQAVPAPT